MPHTTPLGLAPIRALDVEGVATVVAGALFSLRFISAKPGSNGLALLAASAAVVVELAEVLPSVALCDGDATMDVVCGVVDAVPE